MRASQDVALINLCRQASDAGRSVSPFPGSENGNMSDDSRQSVALSQTTAKSKGKPKGRPKGLCDYGSFV